MLQAKFNEYTLSEKPVIEQSEIIIDSRGNLC